MVDSRHSSGPLFLLRALLSVAAFCALSTASMAQVVGAFDPIPPRHWTFKLGYEHRIFYQLEDVSGNDDIVESNEADESTDGLAAALGFALTRRLVFDAGVYYAPGLSTNAMLTNGRRVHNDVDDYGFGFNVRFVPFDSPRVNAWMELGPWFELNKSKYVEFNRSNSPILSEDRTHFTWTGYYAAGGTYWATPSIGVDFSAGYSGRFDKQNANENFRLSTGLVLRLGEQ